MRNSNQSGSPRRGQKGRRPNGKNDRRGGNGQRSSTSSGQQRNPSSRGRTRNQVSQLWASDTTTLSSHLPKANSRDWDSKGRKTESQDGNGLRSRGKHKTGDGKNRPAKFERNNARNQPHPRTGNGAVPSSPAGEAAPLEGAGRVGNIDPFELFCAYHLGITRDKKYRSANINEVANRFRTEPGMIKQALKEYDMDPASLLDREFDMALAQLDIQVAPEGVDRLELARGIYEEFQNAPRIKRDWNKILEEDRKENQKIFRD